MAVKAFEIISVCCTLALAVGCGSGHPAVSGKVTANGQPVEGMKVIFSPVSTTENPFPGPYAQSTTDSEGVYSLVTRDGDTGATKGENIVQLYSTKGLELDFMESQVAASFGMAGGDRNHPSWQTAVEMKEKVDALKSMETGDRMSATVTTKFTVPDEGTDSANFELTEFAKSTRNNQ